MRRFIAQTLALIFILTLVLALGPGVALAATTIIDNGIEYTITASATNAGNGEVTLTNGWDFKGHLDIPPTVKDSQGNIYNVTSIGDSAFVKAGQINRNITSVHIPASVKSIGKYAFNWCDALETVTFDSDSGLTTIGAMAFLYCTNLRDIKIPKGVTSIGMTAFDSCRSLASITIPASVSHLGRSAFYNCWALTSVTILPGVTSIEQTTFGRCRSLTSITIPDSVTSIADNAFQNANQNLAITLSVSNNTTVNSNNSYTPAGGKAVELPLGAIAQVELLPGGTVTNGTDNNLTIIVNGQEESLAPGESKHNPKPIVPSGGSYSGPTLYRLTVEGGEGSGYYPAGRRVAIRVQAGAAFTRWALVSGVGSIGDAFSSETEFVMGHGDAVVQAQALGEIPKTGDGGMLWLGLGLMALGIGVLALKKRVR